MVAEVYKHCNFCNNLFHQRRDNQLFCSEEHRRLSRYYSNIDEFNELHNKWCMWCGERFTSDRKSAKFCSDRCRFAYSKCKPCKYCGEAADGKDHFIPKAFTLTMQNLGWSVKEVIVPCCRECNSTAGAKVFRTLTEKRKYIQSQYRIKYKKLINSPDWTEAEIEQVGPTLQSHVKYSQSAKKIIMARLRWPRL